MSRKRLTGRDQDGSVFPPGTICLRQGARRDSYADARSRRGCAEVPTAARGSVRASVSTSLRIFLPNSVSTVAFLFFA